MIKSEPVHQFLMGLRMFKVVNEKSRDVDEQVCDLMVLLFVCCVLVNTFTSLL